MTEPNNTDLLELATPYALHALSDAEAADLERRVAQSGPDVADAFYADVRSVHETMAVVSAVTAAEPPAHLREQLLAAVADDPVRTLPVRRPQRWRGVAVAAAAVVVIGLGGVGVWAVLRPTPTVAELVQAAPDATTVEGAIPTGGSASVVYSRERDAAVLTMTDVAPPAPGTVYQMWLLPPEGDPVSVGTMARESVTPTTTAVIPNLGDSTTLAFTVEPGDGSPLPTGDVFAALPLT